MIDSSNDYSFIKIDMPVVIKGKKEIVYIIEILGDKIITTNGSYKKEQLSSVYKVYSLLKYIECNQN